MYVCVGERGIKYEYPRLMDQIFSCIPAIPLSTSKHYILFVSDLLYIKWLVHLAITDFIEKTALVVRPKIFVLFISSLKHYIVTYCLVISVADVCGWMLEHKLISHMKARNYQAIWDVCGQWTWLLNKVWCNGLFSMSSSAILTIMFQLFMVLLSECF